VCTFRLVGAAELSSSTDYRQRAVTTSRPGALSLSLSLSLSVRVYVCESEGWLFVVKYRPPPPAVGPKTRLHGRADDSVGTAGVSTREWIEWMNLLKTVCRRRTVRVRLRACRDDALTVYCWMGNTSRPTALYSRTPRTLYELANFHHWPDVFYGSCRLTLLLAGSSVGV